MPVLYVVDKLPSVLTTTDYCLDPEFALLCLLSLYQNSHGSQCHYLGRKVFLKWSLAVRFQVWGVLLVRIKQGKCQSGSLKVVLVTVYTVMFIHFWTLHKVLPSPTDFSIEEINLFFLVFCTLFVSQLKLVRPLLWISIVCRELLLTGTTLFVTLLLKISIENHFSLSHLWNSRWCSTMLHFLFPTLLITTSHLPWLAAYLLQPECAVHCASYTETVQSIHTQHSWSQATSELRLCLLLNYHSFETCFYFLWWLPLSCVYILIINWYFSGITWFLISKKFLVGRYTDTSW